MKVIEISDKEYPSDLRKIKDAPKKIFVEGNINNLNSLCLGVVGSRNNSEYGRKWCEKFVKKLVKSNVTIVSGMAIGIDTIAHNTAIEFGGRTIAVLPSGLRKIGRAHV